MDSHIGAETLLVQEPHAEPRERMLTARSHNQDRAQIQDAQIRQSCDEGSQLSWLQAVCIAHVEDPLTMWPLKSGL